MMNTQQIHHKYPQTLPVDPTGMSHWVGSWYAAPVQMQPAHLEGRRLYQIVHLHAGGRQIRLRLSNRYGNHPLTLTEVSVGHALFGLWQEGPVQPVLFGGQKTVMIAAGADVVSDPVNLLVEPFSNLAISFLVAAGDIRTGHFIASQTSYVSIPDARSTSAIAATEELLAAYPFKTNSWWALTGVDVLPEQSVQVVVTLGDSITDGYGSTVDMNRRYPDVLARRLATSGTRFLSVLNAGICWNELLANRFPQVGEATLRRLSWDVLEQTAVTDLIVQIGINDLRHDAQATDLIAGLQHLAIAARGHHLRMFGSTILPGSYTVSQARQWHLVNSWLREQGTQVFDIIFDFAARLGDPEDETKLHPSFNSGDNIHPNDAGYQAMAEMVDLAQLTGRPA